MSYVRLRHSPAAKKRVGGGGVFILIYEGLCLELIEGEGGDRRKSFDGLRDCALKKVLLHFIPHDFIVRVWGLIACNRMLLVPSRQPLAWRRRGEYVYQGNFRLAGDTGVTLKMAPHFDL